MYIISHILRFSTSMPRVPEFWENRYETLKEGRVRAPVSHSPINRAELVNYELISYNAGAGSAVRTNSKDEEDCVISKDDFYTEARAREERQVRHIIFSLQLFIYYVFYISVPLLFSSTQLSSIIPTFTSPSF